LLASGKTCLKSLCSVRRQFFWHQEGFVAQIAFAKDSLSESIVLSGGDEQLDTDDIQDPKLESV
jgi:hypothetical protein